jgi:hypothetical protein
VWSHFRRLALPERLRFLIDGVVLASRLLVERFGLEFLTRYRDQLPQALGIPPGGDPRLTRLIVEDCADQMRLADPQLAAPILAAVIIQIAPCWSRMRVRTCRPKRSWTRCSVCCCATSGPTQSRRKPRATLENPNSISVRPTSPSP